MSKEADGLLEFTASKIKSFCLTLSSLMLCDLAAPDQIIITLLQGGAHMRVKRRGKGSWPQLTSDQDTQRLKRAQISPECRIRSPDDAINVRSKCQFSV